tara:strand:- start:109 stop:1149 length:1041 start_codon:yes stop_codon:yes gene_type:complete
MAVGDIVDPIPSDTGQVTGTESSLSNWAGPYVTDMLGKGQALANQPYQGYDGPLSAGASDLQSQGFGGIAGLTLPDGYGDAAGMATDTFNSAAGAGQYDSSNMSTNMWNNDFANQYMNPYVQQALNPQLDELNRQSQIQRQQDNASLTKAGAYGGSRQAIMNSELNDNTARLMNETVGQGYSDAYNTAGSMFTSDMGRQFGVDQANEQSRQFGAGLGIDALRTQLDAGNALTNATNAGLSAERDIYGDQLNAGAAQRGITSEGMAADKAQFEEERDYPYKALQYQHSLLGGMPLAAQNTSYTQPSWLSQFGSGTGGIMDILDRIFQTDPMSGNADTGLDAEQYDFT